MNELDYISELIEQLKLNNYDKEFIEKCEKYCQSLLNLGLPILFDEKHIDLILEIDENQILENSYHTFNISNSLKSRKIIAPSVDLKRKQKWILENILCKSEISENSYGFRRGYSIKDNAALHKNNAFAICFDIQDFFPSIKKESVVEVFKKFGYTKKASKRLSEICCYYNYLPQGAPTSPCIANAVCYELDNELVDLAKKYNASYSRYADDITFSSNKKLDNIVSEVKPILCKYGFKINTSKTEFYKENRPKFITGLVVQNGNIRVPKQFKRKLRQEIYYCKKFGVATHLRNTKTDKIYHYREHLYGKAYYIKMIEESVGENFLKQLDEIYWPQWMI